MSGFSIGCTTCHARLVVRDPSAIGQILACPKCGSMVFVRAPEAGGNSSPSSPEASGGTPASPAIASPRAAAPRTLFDEDFDLSAAPAAAPPAAPPPAAPTTPPAPVTGVTPAVSTPPIASTPHTASQLAGFVWIGGGVVGGLVLALGIFFLMAWLGSHGDSPPVADASAIEPPRSPGRDASPDSPDSDSAPKPIDMVSIPEEGDVEPLPVAPDRVADVPSKEEVEPGTKDAKQSPNPSAPEAPADPPKPAASSPPVVSPPASQPPVPKDPRQDAEPQGPPDLTPRRAKDSPSSLRPVAGRFADLLSDGFSEPSTTPSSERGEKPNGKSGEAALSVPGEEEIVRPRMREIDVPGRLADPIGKLQIKAMPLADFAALMSDLSTIPVTLDADALRMRWISPTTPVTVMAEQTTVRGVLTAGIEPLQLGLLVANGQVRITDSSAAESLQRRRSHDVADLVGADPQQLEILAQWVLELIQPESWTDAGGVGTLKAEKGTLVVQNRDAVHFQVLYLCDKLRAARKLPPRGKYASSLLAPGSLPTRAQAALQTNVKLNFNRATRLTQILARVGKVADVRILVDWEAVQEAGWTPDALAKLTVDGKSLSETLVLLLGPRDLTYRVIDDETLEVSTPAAVERHVEWEFYPAGDLLAVDQDPRPLIEQLHDAVGANHFRAFGGSGSIRFDTVSRSLLIALPEPQQRRAAQWLAEKR